MPGTRSNAAWREGKCRCATFSPRRRRSYADRSKTRKPPSRAARASNPPFVAACERNGVELTVLSGGIATLIERALERAGLERVAVLANDARASADGWRMTFRDESDYGHDKTVAVRDAQQRGLRAAFVGDGVSDFEAALAADARFAKRGRALESFLRERNADFTPFSDFAEVERALFAKTTVR